MTRTKKIKRGWGDRSFYVVNNFILLFSFLIIAVPLVHVVSASFSEPGAIIRGEVGLLPVGFNVEAYKQVFASKMLMTGYLNSIIYTFVGTCINIVMTVMAAYPLSVRDFYGRKVFIGMFILTMVFTAPLIPTYLNIKSLGMLDSMWALVIPSAISVYNMIIARTFFSGISEEMVEAARIDGADDLTVLLRVILPVSKSILAVLVLYYAVYHWNTYFDAYIYLSSSDKFPLQVVLRNIMSTAAALQEMANATAEQTQRAAMVEVLRYAIIVVGSVPVIALYPFVQKHFVKGVMIGSVKG